MIRRITDKHAIAEGIDKTLNSDHPRWLEKVLLLVGFYTSDKPFVRSVRVH